ncbi:hypothetical protein BDV93DRAFT_193964 [Ceratobasidium sp. AG-I]|nr:hypothetical protein BDV93DRAFT_193964 [Ceratobasidium sp. AG-I]
MSARYELRKRQPKVPPVGIDESLVSDDDGSFTDDAPHPESTNRKTKRARTSKTSRKKKNSKPTGRSRLSELPVEIFTEITSFTYPGDLLSLARSCKRFREILMGRSAIKIWRFAEGNLKGLPPCPKDMSEPQYAALLFTRICTSCGANTSSRADPYLLVRLCSECRETELEDARPYHMLPDLRLAMVLTTDLMKFKLKNAGRCSYGSGGTEYCLAKEAEEALKQRNEMIAAEDSEAFELWRLTQDVMVMTRRLAGGRLHAFMMSVEITRLRELGDLKKQRREDIEERLSDLGWSDEDMDFSPSPDEYKWKMLLNQPKPITDRTWEKLLPQLVPHLEKNRIRHAEKKKEALKQERQKRVYTLLQELKPQINPFLDLIEELGFDPSNPPNSSEDDSTFPKSLVDYPFPNCASVLQAPCFNDVNNVERVDIDMDDVDQLFHENREEVEKEIIKWRKNGERQLVESWKLKAPTEGNGEAPSNSNESQISDLELLLRADTIFAYNPPWHADGQRLPRHYPDFVPRHDSFISYQHPANIVGHRYHRHVQAEKVTKAILKRHDMPDVKYFELKAKGAVFVCERCEDKGPRTWDVMVDHYMEERKIFSRQLYRDPIIETDWEIVIRNSHDVLATEKPFVRILDDPKQLALPTLNLNQMRDCLLCKNYHHRRTVRTLGDMESHLRTVHDIEQSQLGVTHESSAETDSFHERGRKWRLKWKQDWDEFCELNS